MTEAAAIADLATRSAAKPEVHTTGDGREFLVLPASYSSMDVTPENKIPALLPDHIRQRVTLQTTDSLIGYVNRFKGKTTTLFADIDRDRVVAVIDYHGAEPMHADHIGTLTLSRSVEWNLWNGISGKLMGQHEFARFLEENAADIAAPSGAELLEACRDLHAVRRVNFKKAVRTASDNENFEYTDETEAKTKGGIELPTKFLLRLPVYFGEPETELYAFLRWKLDEGELKLGVALHRAEHVRQAVFKKIVVAVAEGTDCQAIFGRQD